MGDVTLTTSRSLWLLGVAAVATTLSACGSKDDRIEQVAPPAPSTSQVTIAEDRELSGVILGRDFSLELVDGHAAGESCLRFSLEGWPAVPDGVPPEASDVILGSGVTPCTEQTFDLNDITTWDPLFVPFMDDLDGQVFAAGRAASGLTEAEVFDGQGRATSIALPSNGLFVLISDDAMSRVKFRGSGVVVDCRVEGEASPIRFLQGCVTRSA